MLHKEEITISDFTTRFKNQVDICIPHYQETCWIWLIQGTNFARLSKDFLLIFNDFAVVMALGDFQAKNSYKDAHAANDSFVCTYNRRNVNGKEKERKSGSKVVRNEMETIEIFNVDVHHSL